MRSTTTLHRHATYWETDVLARPHSGYNVRPGGRIVAVGEFQAAGHDIVVSRLSGERRHVLETLD